MASHIDERIETLKSRIRHGVIPAMATPLQADSQSVDESGIRTLVDFLIDAGVKGLFIGGTTGEGILLDEDNRMRLHELATDAIDGRVPAMIHIGANTSSQSIRLTKHARNIKADALVAVTPFFYPIHNEALIDYYLSLSEIAPEIPLFAYDIPPDGCQQRSSRDHSTVNRQSAIVRGIKKQPRRCSAYSPSRGHGLGKGYCSGRKRKDRFGVAGARCRRLNKRTIYRRSRTICGDGAGLRGRRY